MYCLYVGFDYTHIDRVLNPFWTHNFGFKPLLGLEPMKPISPQFPARHSYVCKYVCIYEPLGNKVGYPTNQIFSAVSVKLIFLHFCIQSIVG